MANFQIKQHDTRPAIQMDLSADPTDVISSAVFNLRGPDGTIIVNRQGCIIVNQPSATSGGTVKYQWQPGDTALAVSGCQAETEVTFNDGRVETYPNKGFIGVDINPDIA